MYINFQSFFERFCDEWEPPNWPKAPLNGSHSSQNFSKKDWKLIYTTGSRGRRQGIDTSSKVYYLYCQEYVSCLHWAKRLSYTFIFFTQQDELPKSLTLASYHTHPRNRDNTRRKVATIWGCSDGVPNSIDNLFYKEFTLKIYCLRWNKKAKQLSSPLKKQSHCFVLDNGTISILIVLVERGTCGCWF